MKKEYLILILVVVVIMIAFAPLGWIWALNTLFGLSIPFTWKTWAAMHLISAPMFYRAGK